MADVGGFGGLLVVAWSRIAGFLEVLLLRQNLSHAWVWRRLVSVESFVTVDFRVMKTNKCQETLLNVLASSKNFS